MTNTIIQYTNDELKQLTNKDLLSAIMEFKGNHSLHWLSRLIKRVHLDIYSEVKARTSFLDKFYQDKYDSLPARLYCIEHNIKQQPICQNPNCSNPVGWYPSTNSFRKYCSVKCSVSCDETRQKTKQTVMEHYGVEHVSQSSDVQEKMRKTWLKNLGVDHPMKAEAVKEKLSNTMLRRHGVEHALQSDEFIDKVKQTNKKNFGCDWYTQTTEYHKTSHKKYTNPKYPDMEFATSWEFKVYDFLTEHNISFEYQPSISIPYEYDGKQHTYHPDFRVGDRIVEVKGDHFFRINESTGQEEMYCPYRYPDWSDEKYAHICGIYEAKHQCMLKNNVIILRGNDIRNLQYDNFMRTLHSDNNMV